MAFIRSYSRSASLRAGGLDLGDPFSLRIPKKLRKWKPGRTLAGIARAGLSFVPGGGVLARLAGIAQKYGMPLDQLQGFARSYGYDVGDPGGKTPKRKQASTGTKRKSAAKKERRAERVSKPKGKARRPSGSSTGVDWGKLGEAATSLLPVGADLAKEIGRQIGEAHAGAPPPGFADDLAAAMGGSKGMRLPGMRGHKKRRVIDVTALNRAAGRIAKFEKLVSRIHASKPMRRITARVTSGARRRGARGHRSGCGCAVCRRAA